MSNIHSTAIVDPKAEIADDAKIDAYSFIGPDVKIGPGCVIGPHAVVNGPTEMGNGNRVFQFASIGEEPQDLKYKGEPTRLEVGNNNVFREHVTINRGTVQGGGLTKIGDGNLFMAASHAAHDCVIGSGCIIANYAGLTGHVTLFDGCVIGGQSGIHQFARVGQRAFLAGNTMCYFDIPPFCRASGDRAALFGLNVIGLKRAGMSSETLAALQKVYAIIVRAKTPIAEAIVAAREEVEQLPEVVEFIEFCAGSERGITREK
jgi:UDP-N-acetylglucosamine acyltransferase